MTGMCTHRHKHTLLICRICLYRAYIKGLAQILPAYLRLSTAALSVSPLLHHVPLLRQNSGGNAEESIKLTAEMCSGLSPVHFNRAGQRKKQLPSRANQFFLFTVY